MKRKLDKGDRLERAGFAVMFAAVIIGFAPLEEPGAFWVVGIGTGVCFTYAAFVMWFQK